MKKVLITLTLFLCLCGHTAAQQIDVILIGGQSNSVGQGLVANLPHSFTIDNKVLIYFSRYLNEGKNSMQWVPLQAASDNASKFGVELSLGRALHTYYPNKKIALIKHALNGSNLYKQWNPGNRTGEQTGEEYQKFITTVRAGLKELEAQGFTPAIRAMVWQQGEADARELAGAINNRAYGKNLNNFIRQIRKDINCPGLLFVYGTVLPLAAERFVGRDLIKEAQYGVSAASHSDLSVENTVLVPADDLQMLHTDYHTPDPKDDVHLGTFGLLTLGERFAEAIHNALPE